MPLSTGQILTDRYRIVKLLGQGGFGAVYRAWDINLETPRAIKENLDISPEAQRQFKREAQILDKLSHSNLPKVIDHFIIPVQGQYLVMEFVEGEDLQEMLQWGGGPLPEVQVLQWIGQVCDALEYLHSQNPPIVHRDIKPANIKITPQGKAMLVDFGIAKIYDPDASTTSGAKAVTPGYSPPEQYGEKTDARVDIYAIGATLFHLLTGQKPPESVKIASGFVTLRTPHQLNSNISWKTEASILKSMEIDVKNRFQSIAEFHRALTKIPLPQGGEGGKAPGWAVTGKGGTVAVPQKRFWDQKKGRILVITSVTLIFISLMIIGILSITTQFKTSVAIPPTDIPGPSLTFTSTPTPIGDTPIPTILAVTSSGPPPLWTLLEATYTPTPLYINTPHPVNEAYRFGLQAYLRGDWDTALKHFEQATGMETDAPDILFYVGEVYRMRGDFESALEAYDKALAIDPNFAPAYLGKALAQRALDPKTDITEDLQLAIQKDPAFAAAYIELAAYQLASGESQAALENLDAAEELLPESPLVYLYRALAKIQMGNPKAALEDARRANQLDLTSLLSYRVLAEAAIANNDHALALKVINTYLLYEDKDPYAWLIQGEALYASGQYSETLTALNTALNLDKDLRDAHLYRGLTYIELGQGREAVNEIYLALKLDPYSFDLNLQFGRALFAAERYDDAISTFDRAFDMAETDSQRGQVYYYRALSQEAIAASYLAVKDWQALLELPEGSVPEEWLETARERLGVTPTPTTTLRPLAVRLNH